MQDQYDITNLLFQNMMTRSLDDIYTYEKQAFDSIPIDHPKYAEIRALLIDQVNDEVEEYAHSRPNRGASTT
mgnify:CR=1 FL=1